MKKNTTTAKCTLTVEMWAIARVKPYPKNARKLSDKAVAKCAASIKEFGWQQPIVVDRKGVIVAGHTRLLAGQSLGLAEVPVHVADKLSPAQVKAYRLADNRTAQENEWNLELLGPELLELQALDLDLSLTGFDADELADLMDLDVAESGGGSRSLCDRFGVPPFSVLDARQGYWQDRKRAWLSLGIQSELGRGEQLIPNGGGMSSKDRYAGGGASPGGSPRPACDYTNRERGDGKGRALAGR